MWEATVLEVNKELGITKVTVGYKKGKKEFEEDYQLTELQGEAFLKDKIKQKIAELERTTEVVKEGKIDLSNPVPTPTPVDETKNNYFKKLRKLERAKKLLDLGVITSTEFNTLSSEVKALFKSEYLTDND